MATVDDIKSEVLQLWAIQTNLQVMYRSIFLTAASILVAAALLLFQVNGDWATLLAFLFLFGLGIFITSLWGRLQRDRGLDVDYLRTRLLWAECCANPSVVEQHKVLLGLLEWRAMKDNDARRKIVSDMKNDIPETFRPYIESLSQPDLTRKKMECVQKLFMAFWIILLFYGVYHFRSLFC